MLFIAVYQTLSCPLFPLLAVKPGNEKRLERLYLEEGPRSLGSEGHWSSQAGGQRPAPGQRTPASGRNRPPSPCGWVPHPPGVEIQGQR